MYVVNCTVSNGGIPYGDNFKIFAHYCITREKPEHGGNTPHSRFRVNFLVKWKKATIFLLKGKLWGIFKFLEQIVRMFLLLDSIERSFIGRNLNKYFLLTSTHKDERVFCQPCQFFAFTLFSPASAPEQPIKRLLATNHFTNTILSPKSKFVF